MTPRWVAGVALLLLLSGCGGGTPPAGAEASPVDVAGTTWELQDGTVDGDAVPVSDGYRITLLVDGDQAGGTAACNGYGAFWSVDGGRVTVGEISVEEMGCESDVMAAESTYLGALSKVTNAVREGNHLRLTGDSVDLRFTAHGGVPTEGLIGTTWALDTVIDGETSA